MREGGESERQRSGGERMGGMGDMEDESDIRTGREREASQQ